MSYAIVDVYDQKRLCGWRHPGFYITSKAMSRECGKFPLALAPCDCCGLQVKLTRGLQKVNVHNLFAKADCDSDRIFCRLCLANRTEWGYLIGIGHKHYKHHQLFESEAMEQGVSKRIAFPLPRDFKVGESVVLLGHPKVFVDLVPESTIELPVPEIDEDAPQKALPMIDGNALTTGRMIAKDIPAVIMAFIPERVEYVVGGSEPLSFLQTLFDQGVTLVNVHRVEEKQAKLEV